MAMVGMEGKEKESVLRIERESGVNKGNRLKQREKEKKRKQKNEEWKENGRLLQTFVCLLLL